MPVTVTEYEFAIVELQASVAVPEPVTLLGVMAPQVRLAGTVSVRLTAPAKPLTAVTVIVEVIEVLTVPEGEVAAIVKSTKLNVAVEECVIAGVALVPVIDSVKVPAAAELQETVALPEPVTLEGVIALHVRPAGTVSVSVTVPLNPFEAVTVIVEEADAPALAAVGEVPEIVKSGGAPKVKVTVALWVSEPLVPVTVTEKTLAVVELQERVAVPEPVTLLGVMAPQVRPAGTVSVRLTTPANPFTAVTVIVEVAEDPAGTEAGEAALTVKSWKVKEAVAE